LNSRVCDEASIENDKTDDLDRVSLPNSHKRENYLKNPCISIFHQDTANTMQEYRLTSKLESSWPVCPDEYRLVKQQSKTARLQEHSLQGTQ
jgi:hypothetical protein